MDFWSRLIGGTGAATTNRQANLDGPQQRLTNFKRTYLQLHQSWQKGGRKHSDPAFGATIAPYLQNINRILRDEIHTPAPHLCIQNVATAQVYVLIYSIGSAIRDDLATKEALRFFGLLVDSEDEDFIDDASFADQLVSLVRAASNTSLSPPSDTETEIVELLFSVAAKLRQQAEFPLAWFRPDIDTERSQSPGTGNSTSRSQECPLIYMLLDYIHCDGKVGDFARTGLLYILESAGRSHKLENWIIESELATMMASGLGALYTKLSCGTRAEPIFSPPLQANLAMFLSYLAFWQDVLERCSSADIKATFLDHFDFLFVRPLLYPSLVESSDIDSGSSVAVMTYLRYILENLTHTDVISLLLHYMLGSPSQQQRDTRVSRPTTLARRRKSETLILNNAKRSDDPSPDLLTLTDILQGYLTSRNEQTITASLRLLASILRSWHDIAATKLFRTQVAKAMDQKRRLATHDQFLNVLYSMAEDISDDEGLEGLYESHLQDAQAGIETHACFAQKLKPPGTEPYEINFPQNHPKWLQQRIIAPGDPLLMCLLALLEDFLVNDIEINLSLSENLAALATCKETRLDGWLLGPTSNYTLASRDEGGLKAAAGCTRDAQAPRDSISTASPILTRLSALVERINRLRHDIQDFDIYIAERRHVFRVGEKIDEALADVPVRKPQDLEDSQKSKSKDQAAVVSISERLKGSSDVSQTNSPRGRQQGSSIEYSQVPPKTLAGRLGHLRLSPSPNPSKPLDRTFSPSPLRRTSTSSRTSSGLPSPRGPPDVLHRRIRLKTNNGRRRHVREGTDSEASSIRSDLARAESDVAEETREISLSHLLTNVIILQEFILELAAITQVRASLFGEVSLD
ncbi:MAG: hypothetical protein Q9223_002689 [Gallowayella weberi]